MILDKWLVPTLRALLECACNELADTPGGPVGRRSLLHSNVPVTDGCDCGCDASNAGLACDCPDGARGRVYVRVPRGQARADLLADANVCLPDGWNMTAYIGVSRCVPNCRAEGATDGEEDHMAFLGLNDLLALRRAVRCCGTKVPAQVGVQAWDWTALGPEGCCYGGELGVIVRVP